MKEYWVGIDLIVRTSQGFKPFLPMNIGGYDIEQYMP
jgi:hypothetical protein